jgi:AcrR family transcriptional regulator
MASSEPSPRLRKRRALVAAPADGGIIDEIGAQRRAPFGDNPDVGVRGTRTQRRIIQAALDVFGEVGYHACRIERITERAGCSRPSFYQYFSSKEDLFRQLTGEVAREIARIDAGMGDITPDRAGWYALRGWLEASGALYEAYWPVFTAFDAALGSDAALASGARRVGDRMARVLGSRIDPSALLSDEPEVVAGVLRNGVRRAFRYRQLLLDTDPDAAPDRDQMLDDLAEVLHRSLFGARGGGMLPHRPAADPGAALPPLVALAPPADVPSLGLAARATRQRLLDAARQIFLSRGFDETRVDDIVAAAGTSHGTFYRYFTNKDEIFRALAVRAGSHLARVTTSIPDIGDQPASATAQRRLARWVDDYATVWAEEGAIFRIWVEAIAHDEELTRTTSAAIAHIRAVLVRFLSHRDFGDDEVDAFLLLSMLDLMEVGEALHPDRQVRSDVLLAVIRLGFLGLDPEQ